MFLLKKLTRLFQVQMMMKEFSQLIRQKHMHMEQFSDCITAINNTQVDDAQKIDVVMPTYNLIEYNDAYLKTSGSLWQYYRDEPALINNGEIIDFSDNNNNNNNNNNNSASFKFKLQITGQTENGRTEDLH